MPVNHTISVPDIQRHKGLANSKKYHLKILQHLPAFFKTLGSAYKQSVYIQCNNIAMTICLYVFLIQIICQGKYEEYCLKNVIFLSGLV